MSFQRIRTEADNEAALKRIDDIFHARPGTTDGDELEHLLHLVETFETARYPIAMPNLPPEQCSTQRLVDEFNQDEAAWRQRLQKALESIRTRRKRRERAGENA